MLRNRKNPEVYACIKVTKAVPLTQWDTADGALLGCAFYAVLELMAAHEMCDHSMGSHWEQHLWLLLTLLIFILPFPPLKGMLGIEKDRDTASVRWFLLWIQVRINLKGMYVLFLWYWKLNMGFCICYIPGPYKLCKLALNFQSFCFQSPCLRLPTCWYSWSSLPGLALKYFHSYCSKNSFKICQHN